MPTTAVSKDLDTHQKKNRKNKPCRSRKNDRNEFFSLSPVPLEAIDPGMRTMKLNIQDVKDNAPELLVMLQQIKSNYLNFISEEAISLGQIEIVPCLVGSQCQRLHPEAILGKQPVQNDFDWEFFCLIKNPAEFGQFIDQLFSKITIADYFSHDYKLNMRSISTHFNYSMDNNTNVDVKFTIFTTQKTEDMIYRSMNNRVICPKANIVKFAWNLEATPFITIHYYRNWLDFTICPTHQDSKEYRPEFIAYALLFHYLNPHYPMTNRFIFTITKFFKVAWHNTELLESTKIKFVALCCKKFCRPGAITSEVSLKPGEEFAGIFTSMSFEFFEPHRLCIINLIGLDYRSEHRIPAGSMDLTVNVDPGLCQKFNGLIKGRNSGQGQPLIQYNPDVIDFVPSVSKTLANKPNSANSETKEIAVTHKWGSTDKPTFFPHYKNIDSFCDAVIRQFILINSHRLLELGSNSMVQLKHKMNPDNGLVDMNQVFQKFNTEYPEINLIIYSSDMNILHEIKGDHSSTQTLTMSLMQHGDRYSPILSLHEAPMTKVIESRMSTIRLVEPW